MIVYEGKLVLARGGDSNVATICLVELVGDCGKSGAVRVDLADASERLGRRECAFRVEAVSVGRLHSLRIFVTPTTPLGSGGRQLVALTRHDFRRTSF